MNNETITYCDHCGEPTPTTKMYHCENLPVDIDSANVGESGSVCTGCQYELGL